MAELATAVPGSQQYINQCHLGVAQADLDIQTFADVLAQHRKYGLHYPSKTVRISPRRNVYSAERAVCVPSEIDCIDLSQEGSYDLAVQSNTRLLQVPTEQCARSTIFNWDAIPTPTSHSGKQNDRGSPECSLFAL